MMRMKTFTKVKCQEDNSDKKQYVRIHVLHFVKSLALFRVLQDSSFRDWDVMGNMGIESWSKPRRKTVEIWRGWSLEEQACTSICISVCIYTCIYIHTCNKWNRVLIINVRVTFDALHMILGHALFWFEAFKSWVLPQKFEMAKILNLETMHMGAKMTILPLQVGPYIGL